MAKEKNNSVNKVAAVVNAIEFGFKDDDKRVVVVHVEPFTAFVGGFEATINSLTLNMNEFKDLVASMSKDQVITFEVGKDANT